MPPHASVAENSAERKRKERCTESVAGRLGGRTVCHNYDNHTTRSGTATVGIANLIVPELESINVLELFFIFLPPHPTFPLPDRFVQSVSSGFHELGKENEMK